MLDLFFLQDSAPAAVETGQYNYFLVLLSWVVACAGSYTGLSLSAGASASQPRHVREIMGAAAAFALGSGIWSMHFIGMLAYHMDIAISYDPWLTFLSMAFAVSVGYGVLRVLKTGLSCRSKIVLASTIMAAAIGLMHYVGMAAMVMDAQLLYKPWWFALSLAAALVLSAVALVIAYPTLNDGTIPTNAKGLLLNARRGYAAAVMGTAISALHYIGMAAAVFSPFAECQHDPSRDFGLLAFVVAAAAGTIFTIAFSTALYLNGQHDAGSDKERQFPTRILVAAAAITLIAALWSTGSCLYINFTLKNDIRRNIDINDAINHFAYLNHNEGYLRQMYASTGDPSWKYAYYDNANLLDRSFTEAKNLAVTPLLRDSISAIDTVSALLRDMGSQSFNLRAEGKDAEAASVLNSLPYFSLQHKFIRLRYDFADNVNTMFRLLLTKFGYSVSSNLYFSLMVLLVLPTTWYFAFRSVRYWRQEMETTRANLAARELELQRFIGEIEMSQTAAMKARSAAERANAAKSDFLANTSHEIRTPMNGILGMARLLLGTDLTAEQRSWVDIIHNSGETLMSLINDILDLSKIEAGRLTLDSNSFDLHQSVAEVMDMLILRAQEKNIDLILKIAPETPRYLVGDTVRIKQIILNLTGNAVKFTSKGYVLVNISGAVEPGKSEIARNVRLVIRVEDTGIGIPKDKMAYIFDKFTQAEESTTRRFGGTGLGLAISRQLVTMMGGTIELDSVVGQGSIFTFDLLLPIASQVPESQVPSCRLKELRMLTLCDNEYERQIVSGYVDGWNMLCHDAHTFEDALQRLQEAVAANQPFHFVYIDHKASVQKILGLAARAHATPGMQDLLFIVAAIFGSATASRVLSSNEIAALLTKPLFPDQLQDACKILWDARSAGKAIPLVTRSMISQMQGGETKQYEQTNSFHGTRVLVVEDMQVNQMLMAKILEKLGCEIESATNGLKALDKLKTTEYDIVFMDCHMPEMDGFEATREIRQSEARRGKHTIIVALTADAMTGDREKCLNAGMDDYINKPFKPEQIAQMLKKWQSHN